VVLLNVKHLALNSTRMKSLLIMKNILDIEDLDVAGNSNINKNREMDMSFI
jgi:hypothetical protein